MTTTKTQFVYVTYISTTPEKLWAALQDPEMTKQFWGMRKNISDWSVGSTWAHVAYDDDKDVAVTGTIVESNPPKRLVITWVSPMAPQSPTRVTFDIEASMGAVKLTVTHDELELGTPLYNGTIQGWPAILSSLKSLLETGTPLMMTTRKWTRPPQG